MEYHQIMGLFFCFMHLHRKEVQSVIDEYELYHGQLPILETIKNNDGCTQNKLVELIHVSAPSMTNSIKRLEKNGLVTKSIDPNDNRRSVIHITSKGIEVSSKCRSKFDEADRKTFKNLSAEELEQLHAILKKLISNLKEEDNNA